jgi:uncharacterized protein YyaL (SSP411 family)
MSERENALGKAASAYLRSARHQPIEWNEWGTEAFAKAQRENKPVLLDIGAVWCHWCHVMDRESYEDPKTAAILNEKFVAVKVDRDERPDVDARYQAAVSAISGQGGWPLTAFLTPEGKPYFGGTYFPPDERYGRPSFQRVLLTMAEAFANKRDEVEDSAGSVLRAIEYNESFSGRGGVLDTSLVQKIIAAALQQFDERNGGFGSQPKFPHPGALDLLIDAAARGDARAKHVVTVTLNKMAAGGIYDQLAGGFHRYSVDERWIVPHFEKMAYDNSELLKNYAHAYQAFGEARFAEVAKDIMRWMDEWLSDRERGGFYASQDADDSLEDDGDYFTWTRAEAEAVLTPEEFEVAAAYFNIRPVGDMHHNPQKNVLHVPSGSSRSPLIGDKAADEWATRSEVLASAKEKMYAARLLRKTPYVDETVYAGWNGMCISAYIAAGRALGLKQPVTFALKTLDRVLAVAWRSELGMAHVVAYGEGVEAPRIAGGLEDYAFVAVAALDAWEATGELRYFTVAQEIGNAMLARFCDSEAGDAMSRGFFDTEYDAAAIGALSARRKPLQDSPTPAGNAVAATLLLRLYALTGNALYESRARDTLETFAGVVEHFGLYAASYGLALRRAIEPPVQVCIIGSDEKADELEATALKRYVVNKSVIRLHRPQLGALPPALAETLPHLPGGEGSVAVVCKGNSCLPPIGSVEELVAVLFTAV